MNKLIFAAFFIVFLCSTDTRSADENKSKSIQFFNSEEASTSNFPFSEAVRVGNLIFLSGQIGYDYNTGKLVPGGITEEANQTMTNIKNTLTNHGYSMSNIVKCTVMIANITEWQKFNDVYVKYFSKPYPARSAFGANGLAFNAKVEVECVAVVSA